MKYDTLIMSDFHLGSAVSKTEKILEVLNNTKFDRLIINGDLLDSHNFKRFKKQHWKVLSTIRKLTRTHKVVFIFGNHESNLKIISLILGIDFLPEYNWEINGRKFLATHGHRSDSWISKRPILTEIFTGIYYYIQLIDKKQFICKFLKLKSKSILKVDKMMRNGAFQLAEKRNVDFITHGHSHLADKEIRGKIEYMNSGSFSENPCHYILIDKYGEAELKEI